MARNPGLDLVEHGNRRADLPGRAIAALIAVMLDERGLHGVQVFRCTQPFDRLDLVALMHDRERQARIDPPPTHDDRAGAALAVIATLLGAGEMQMFAQRIKQRRPRVERDFARLAIDVEGDFRHRDSLGGGSLRRSRGRLCIGHRRRRAKGHRCGGSQQQFPPR